MQKRTTRPGTDHQLYPALSSNFSRTRSAIELNAAAIVGKKDTQIFSARDFPQARPQQAGKQSNLLGPATATRFLQHETGKQGQRLSSTAYGRDRGLRTPVVFWSSAADEFRRKSGPMPL